MKGREITVVSFDFKGENSMQDHLPGQTGVVEGPYQHTGHPLYGLLFST